MPTLNALTINDLQSSGQYGNCSDAYMKHTQAGAGTIADKIRLGVIPAGSRVTGFREVHSAHGGASTGSCGYENVDGTAGGTATFFAAAASTTAAGGLAVAAFSPFITDKDIYITFTNGVAAIPNAATVEVVVSYVNIGPR